MIVCALVKGGGLVEAGGLVGVGGYKLKLLLEN